MSGSTELSAAAVAALLQAQGVGLAPGRAEKIAASLAPLLQRSAADAATVPLDPAPPDYSAVLQAMRWRP